MAAISSILGDLFILFAAAKLGGALLARLGQPAVVGELLAGMLVGPHLLGWVGAPDPALVALFHGDAMAAREALGLVYDLLAELGVILLLFFVGLETRLSDLIGVGRRAALVGGLGVAVPFLAGFGVMTLRGAPAPVALFAAAALVATSTGITARVLRDLHALHAREARIILGAAVIDDILAMLLLAAVSQLGPSGAVDPLDIALTAAQALTFTVFVALIGTRTIGRFHTHLHRLLLAHPALALALALMLGLATLASRIGLAAIIGAFLAGLVLAQAREQHALEHAALPIYEFLVPFFFVIVGTRVDPALLRDPRIAGEVLVVTAVAVLAKLAGAGLGALGLGWSPAAIVGVGMVPRGEVGLLVASLGLSRGIIAAEFYAVVVAMSLLTTLLAPPALARFCRPLAHLPGPARGARMGSPGRLPNL